MCNASREKEILRKYPKEMIDIKNSLTEMNSFDGLISKLNTAEERVSKLEDISIQTSKPESKEKNTERKEENIPRTIEQLQRDDICTMGIPKVEERNRRNV